MARGRSSQPQIITDLSAVARALASYPSLTRVLTDPSASREGKSSLIDSALPWACEQARSVIKREADKSWSSSEKFVASLAMASIDETWAWAEKSGNLRESIDQVFAFGLTVAAEHGLREALTDRRTGSANRRKLAESIMVATHPPAIAAVSALVGMGEGTIDDRIRAVVDRGVERLHARLAIVRVVKPLDDDQRARLVATLSARFGSDIVLEEIVDPAVIGGVRVECGAQVIDSTVSSRLEAARRALG